MRRTLSVLEHVLKQHQGDCAAAAVAAAAGGVTEQDEKISDICSLELKGVTEVFLTILTNQVCLSKDQRELRV